jgi:PHD/YefM family antitoxin component YafN of YafNO toxin-antitoxin module
MTDQPLGVSADDFESLLDAVRRARGGATVLSHGEHVPYLVPPSELDRMRETIRVLSDLDGSRPAS